MLRNAGFILTLLALGCCGYSVRALLPPHLKTISVQPVENQTIKPGLDLALTDSLVKGFARDGSLRVADLKEADLVLRCKIDGYEKLPQTYGANQDVTTWRITLRAQIESQDQAKSQSLSSGVVSVTANYDAGSETEEQGIARALDKLRTEIIRRTLIAW